MKTIKINTAELSGVALDWAVAKAIEWKEPIYGVGSIRQIDDVRYLMMDAPDPDEPDDVTEPRHFNHYAQWSPSRFWSQGGPLIEKYYVSFYGRCTAGEVQAWSICLDSMTGSDPFDGDTHLIAAMRSIVALKLGDTVDVPADLVEPNK